MANIFAEVVIAPADIYFLARDRISAVAIVLRLARQCAHIAARLRFGQVHRATPFPRNELGQIDRLDLLTGVMLQRLDLALRHQRVKRDTQTRGAHHLVDSRGHSHGQPHTAILWARRHRNPATLTDRFVALSKTF